MGFNRTQKLKSKLSKKELKKREKQFEQAERFIRNAGQNGGIQSPVKISYENPNYNDGTRVDIEVWAG